MRSASPRSRRVRTGAWLALSAAAVSVCAQTPQSGASQAAGRPAETAAPQAATLVEGDAALGARLASQGAGAAAACAGCHGANGEGNPGAGFPRLAGQSASYLLRQLQAYAGGARQNPVMMPIAKALDEAQQRAVAVHYAGLAAPAGAAPKAASNTSRGQQLAKAGDNTLRVQACANCHGAGGIGQAPAYPYLAGQPAGYLEAALGEWKSGARKTDPSGQMPLIAQRLGDADVRAVAAYYAGLPPPPPSTRDVAEAWRPARALTVVSGPKSSAGGGAPQGVGTEQGAPTTGGAQGPGGGGAATGAGPQGNRTGGTPPTR